MTIPTIPELDSLDLIQNTGLYQVAGKYLVQAAGRPNEFPQPWQAVVHGYGMYVFKNLEPIGLAVIAGGRRYWAPITCQDPRAPARGELVEVLGQGPFLPPNEDGNLSTSHDYTVEIEAEVEAKLAQLAAMPVGPITGRRLELGGDVDHNAAYIRRAMVDIGQRLGLHFLQMTPAVALEQLCIMSAVKDHDTAGLLKSLLNSFLVAYVTPETCDQAYAHLVGLESLRRDVSNQRDSQKRAALAQAAQILAGANAPTKH